MLEAARDLLKQSQEAALTSLYFYDLSERLERLLFEVNTGGFLMRYLMTLLVIFMGFDFHSICLT